jgi:hypothetical protein
VRCPGPATSCLFERGCRLKCFYHTEMEGVGFCTQCGKSACRDCIEDIGGAMLCKGCMVRALQQRSAVKADSETKQVLTRDTASRRLRTSKILFLIAAGVGLALGGLMSLASLGDPKSPSIVDLIFGVPLGSLFAGYVVWSCYWGIPAVWRGWWGMFRNVGCFLIANPLFWIFAIVALFEIPLFFGYMYGVMGGGIYEYWKCRRVAEGIAPVSRVR